MCAAHCWFAALIPALRPACRPVWANRSSMSAALSEWSDRAVLALVLKDVSPAPNG